MPTSAPKKFFRKRRFIPKKRKFVSKAVTVATVRAIVKKEIHNNTENKYASVTVLPTQIPAYIGSNTSAGNIFPILPTILRGTNNDERVGAKITPRSLIIKGYVVLDLNDLSHDYDRVCVRLIAGFPKRFPKSSDALQELIDHPDQNWTNRIINTGAVDSPFDGTLQALQSPVNRSTFTVKAQKYLSLSRPRFYDAALVGSDGFRESVNTVKFFKMVIKCPKTINFDVEGNSGYPNNFSPVLCAGYTLMNGSSPGIPSATSPKPVQLSFTTRFQYEDA